MSNRQKMKLEDLQPKPVDHVNWNILDAFFYVDAPAALNKALMLTKMIKDLRITEMPEVDSNIVLSYLSKMSKDATEMSNSLVALRDAYAIKKQVYQGNYNEDSHMYSLSISHDMQEWLEQYESTIAQSINDVVDYINNTIPSDRNVQLTK